MAESHILKYLRSCKTIIILFLNASDFSADLRTLRRMWSSVFMAYSVFGLSAAISN